MKDSISIVYILLVSLTIMTVWITTYVDSRIIVTLVVSVALIKFWLVAFRFMELSDAHPLWKYLIIIYGTLIGLILIVLL